MTGKKWGPEERKEWQDRAVIEKNYQQEVLDKLFELPDCYRLEQYGQLSYDPDRYPLYAVLSRDWNNDLPTALITAGVHGYEIGGVYAALKFLKETALNYLKSFNLIVIPSVSPWGFETNNRWNPYAVDPNRSFTGDNFAEESDFLKKFAAKIPGEILVHIDLHETTDRDKTVFRPALAARDGLEKLNDDIPQGFYLVADEERPELDFQQAVVRSVEEVTLIADKDEQGRILNEPAKAHGVIYYAMHKLGLSGTLTTARFHTTTEVYPDGDWMTPESSVESQIAAIRGGLDYVREYLNSCKN